MVVYLLYLTSCIPLNVNSHRKSDGCLKIQGGNKRIGEEREKERGWMALSGPLHYFDLSDPTRNNPLCV